MKKIIAAAFMSLFMLTSCGAKEASSDITSSEGISSETSIAEDENSGDEADGEKALPESLELVDESYKPEGAVCRKMLYMDSVLSSVIFVNENDDPVIAYSSGKPLYVLEYTNKYNDSGDLTESEMTDTAHGNIIRNVFKYDNEHRKTSHKNYTNDELVTDEDYTYNENGDVATYARINPAISSAGTKETYEYEYDDNGNPVHTTTIDIDGSIISETDKTFDENGNTLTATVVKNGSVWSVNTYTYDEKGRMTSRVTENKALDRTETMEVVYEDLILASIAE